MPQSHVNLSNLRNGQLDEAFGWAQEEVLKNIRDISTDWKPVRKVTIEITYQAVDENREEVNCQMLVTPKTLSLKGMAARLSIGEERVQGEMHTVAFEMMRPGENKNQANLFGDVLTKKNLREE